MSTHAFTVKEALSFGWNTFKNNWQFLVIVFAIVYATGLVPAWIVKLSNGSFPAITSLASLCVIVLQMIIAIGVIVISLKIVDRKKPEITDLFTNFPLLLNYFLGALLYAGVIIVGIILLIIPGIIWGIKYQYTMYLIIDKKMGPFEAFKKSGKITQGNKMRLFWLGLSFGVLYMAGELLLHIGLILVYPIIYLSGAYVYRKLSPKQ